MTTELVVVTLRQRVALELVKEVQHLLEHIHHVHVLEGRCTTLRTIVVPVHLGRLGIVVLHHVDKHARAGQLEHGHLVVAVHHQLATTPVATHVHVQRPGPGMDQVAPAHRDKYGMGQHARHLALAEQQEHITHRVHVQHREHITPVQ